MFKVKKVLIVFAILSLISLVYIAFNIYKNRSDKQSNISDIQTIGESYNNLTPGKATTEDITKTLGPAINETASGSSKILEYSSKNPNFNNEFNTENGKLKFIKQIVTMEENIKIKDINSKYGPYTNILYGPMSTNGFNLYIYSNKGLAYIGHELSGIVLEIWYFPPTDIKNFQKLYASDYSNSLPAVQ
jgi:hypothetical protein